VKHTLSDSFEFFLSRLAIAMYLNTNVILVGIMLSTKNAGYYGGAEKLLFAITTFYAPLIETIYPYISRTKNIPFIKKVLVLSTSINTIGCIGAFVLAPWIVQLILGTTFKPAVEIFQWMLIIAVLHLPASMIGYPVLGALGYEKTANRSVILGAITHLFILCLFYPSLTQPVHFVWCMIASQLIILITRANKLLQIQR
jgi:PST family polysaccharide transporter